MRKSAGSPASHSASVTLGSTRSESAASARWSSTVSLVHARIKPPPSRKCRVVHTEGAAKRLFCLSRVLRGGRRRHISAKQRIGANARVLKMTESARDKLVLIAHNGLAKAARVRAVHRRWQRNTFAPERSDDRQRRRRAASARERKIV